MTLPLETYGTALRQVLALAGNGERAMPLAGSLPLDPAIARLINAGGMFDGSTHPDAALSGLWLYFSRLEESHGISQSLNSAEGSYWHAIMHRREPDAGNAAYWFRQLKRHPVFPALHQSAAAIIERYPSEPFALGAQWNPFAFIDLCERARQKPGSKMEEMAVEIQLAEWRLLFDFCARPQA
jgi:hypothetical protein